MADIDAAEAGKGASRDAGNSPSGAPAAVAGAGQPILDLPPMVEFDGGFDTPAPAERTTPATAPTSDAKPAAAAAPATGPVPAATPGAPSAPTPPAALAQRPVRRNFLAPIADAPSAHPAALPQPIRAARPRTPAPPPPAAAPAVARPPAPTVAPAPRPPRRWRRRVAVGVGVAAALVLAVGLEVGVSPGWVRHIRTMLVERFTPAPPLPKGNPPTDPVQRVAYYTARAKAGEADSQFELAVLYAKGEGVSQDYTAAAKWFRVAADHGMTRAQYDLGVLYERGRGVPLDHTEAVNWYRKAAEHDYALAQYNLAVAYTKGEGVPHDPSQAANWYRRAAGRGVVAAMVNLAILYERGDGVATSTVDAYAWYRAAARRGSEAAQRRADELLRAFSPADQTLAETKTAEVAGTIHDAITAEQRPATPNAPAGTAAPVLKPGMVGDMIVPPAPAPQPENP